MDNLSQAYGENIYSEADEDNIYLEADEHNMYIEPYLTSKPHLTDVEPAYTDLCNEVQSPIPPVVPKLYQNDAENVVKGLERRHDEKVKQCVCSYWLVVFVVVVILMLISALIAIFCVFTLKPKDQNMLKSKPQSASTESTPDVANQTSWLTPDITGSTSMTPWLTPDITGSTSMTPDITGQTPQCPGDYTSDNCADLYLPMEVVNGNIIQGYNQVEEVLHDSLVNQPSLSSDKKVGTYSLRLEQNQYLELADYNHRCLGNAAHCQQGFTLCAWYKAARDTGSYQTIFSNAAHIWETPGTFLQASIKGPQSVVYHTRVWRDGLQWSNPDYTPFQVNPYHWHHICVSWDHAIKLYLDGNLVQSTDRTWTHPVQSQHRDSGIQIGRRGGSQNVDGYIDDLIFWEQEQPHSVIKYMYKRGKQ